MSEEILSPPYPRDTITAGRLYEKLLELRDWVKHYQSWAEEVTEPGESGQGYVAQDISLHIQDDAATYQSAIAVTDMFKAYYGMRKLRESWDNVVAFYEEEWDCKASVVARMSMLRAGTVILTEAFLTPEVREAKQADEKTRHRNQMRAMLSKLPFKPNMVFDEQGNMLDLSERSEESADLDEVCNMLFHSSDPASDVVPDSATEITETAEPTEPAEPETKPESDAQPEA